MCWPVLDSYLSSKFLGPSAARNTPRHVPEGQPYGSETAAWLDGKGGSSESRLPTTQAVTRCFIALPFGSTSEAMRKILPAQAGSLFDGTILLLVRSIGYASYRTAVFHCPHGRFRPAQNLAMARVPPKTLFEEQYESDLRTFRNAPQPTVNRYTTNSLTTLDAIAQQKSRLSFRGSMPSRPPAFLIRPVSDLLVRVLSSIADFNLKSTRCDQLVNGIHTQLADLPLRSRLRQALRGLHWLHQIPAVLSQTTAVLC